MEAINHECYVSLEVAKLLKKAGFDWEIRSLYDEQNNFVCSLYSDWNNITICKSAPTLEVAQRWLREVKGYNLGVVYSSLYEKWYVSLPNSLGQETVTENNTYEAALEAGIKKALEIILEKGE